MGTNIVEPKGLNMSLDDLIQLQHRDDHPRSNQAKHAQPGRRGGGRGGGAAGGRATEHHTARGQPGRNGGFVGNGRVGNWAVDSPGQGRSFHQPHQPQFQHMAGPARGPPTGRVGMSQIPQGMHQQFTFMRQPQQGFDGTLPQARFRPPPDHAWQHALPRFENMPPIQMARHSVGRAGSFLHDVPNQQAGLPKVIRPVIKEPEDAAPDLSIPPPDYQDYQSCTLDEETGEVSVKYDDMVIVSLKPSGEMTLYSGGIHTASIFQSINDVLVVVGCKLISNSPDPCDFNWQVADGRSLARFQDGMVLPAKGPSTAARPKMILSAFQNPNPVALAASRASMAAATVASTGVANGTSHQNGQSHSYDYSHGKDQSSVRRLQAQGRYAPY